MKEYFEKKFGQGTAFDLDYNMSIYSWIISTNNIFFLNYKKNYGAQASLYYLLNCRIYFGSTGISGKQHKHESIV